MNALDYTVLAAYAVGSVGAFALMGIDKWKAIHKRYRIPERALFVWCACCGAPGGWLGMQVFRHKVRDLKFAIGVPVLMVAQIVLLTLYFRYWR